LLGLYADKAATESDKQLAVAAVAFSVVAIKGQ
jgi:hypothetical protein